MLEFGEFYPTSKKYHLFVFCLFFSISLQSNADELETIEEASETLLKSDLSFYELNSCRLGM